MRIERPTYKGVVGKIASAGALERFIRESPLVRPLVDRFIAGEQMSEALDVVERLNGQGIHATLDNLGEEVKGDNAEAKAETIVQEYLTLLDKIDRRKLDANVSLKLTQLGLVIDPIYGPELARNNLRRILKRAAQYGNFVRIDMEGSNYTQATLDLYRHLYPEYPDVGVVLQSYLRRTDTDLAQLIQERARIRWVKGAYSEPESVAYPRKSEVDDHYLTGMEVLLSEGEFPAIATHDPRMIDHAKAFAQEIGKPKDSFEFQMLYGVRGDLQQSLADDEYGVRVYVPYGTEWYSYFMRRIGERVENAEFLMRAIANEAAASVKGKIHPGSSQ